MLVVIQLFDHGCEFRLELNRLVIIFRLLKEVVVEYFMHCHSIAWVLVQGDSQDLSQMQVIDHTDDLVLVA